MLQQLGDNAVGVANKIQTQQQQSGPSTVALKPVLPPTVEVSMPTARHVLNPVVETATVCTFLHNMPKLSSLVPGVVPSQDLININKVVPLPLLSLPNQPTSKPPWFSLAESGPVLQPRATTKPRARQYQPYSPVSWSSFPEAVQTPTKIVEQVTKEAPLVTLSNDDIVSSPVLQSLVNQTSANTQCLINEVLQESFHLPLEMW